MCVGVWETLWGTAWSSFQWSDCCLRCWECWQPPSPVLQRSPGRHLVQGYSDRWPKAEQFREAILTSHPNPRLLACAATPLPLSNLTSYYSLPQELITRALCHKHPAHWALTLLPRESILWHSATEFSHIACYCVNWFNHLRTLSIVT